MEQAEYSRKLDELDHMLNDDEPAAPPEDIWQLLAELAVHDLRARAAL